VILELPRLSHNAAAVLSTPRRRYSAAHLVGAETACSLAGGHRQPRELRGPRGRTRQGLYHSAQCLTCFWSKKKAARPSIRLRSSAPKKSIVLLRTLPLTRPYMSEGPLRRSGTRSIFFKIFFDIPSPRRPQLPKHPSRTVDATCFRLSIVRFATGPKISIRRLLGPKKNSNLFRGAVGPKWSAAPAKSRQLVVLRPLGGRSRSLLYTRKRLHRMRGRIHR